MAIFPWQGERLAYDDLGEGDGPPAVLVHGFGVCRQFWDAVTPALAGHRRVLVVDWIGYGGSSRPGRGLGLEGHAAAVTAFMATVVGRPCDLVGHSMGASIAALAASAHPEWIARLVLCDPLIRATDGLYPRSRRLVSPWLRPLVKRLLGFRPFVRWFTSNSTDTLPIPENLIAAALTADREVMMRDALDLARLDLTDALARLAMPVLLVGADRDAVVRPAQTALAAARIRNVAIARFPCGHCPPLELPEAFTARLASFLDGAAPAGQVGS
jgi:3-oxoadipate enol-lactonase